VVYLIPRIWRLGLIGGIVCCTPWALSAQEEASTSPLPPRISIEWHKKQIFTIPGIRRFLIMDPTRVQASRTGDTIELMGYQVGSTTLIVWADKRYTARVRVLVPKAIKSYQKARLEKEAQRFQGVLISLGWGYSQNKSGKSFGDLEDTFEPRHDFSLKLDMPLSYRHKKLRMNTAVQWDAQENRLDFSRFYGKIKGIEWPKPQQYDFEFGSVGGINSPFASTGSVRGVRIRPLKFKTPVKKQFFSADILVGETDTNQQQFGFRNLSLGSLSGDLASKSIKKSNYVATQLKYPLRTSQRIQTSRSLRSGRQMIFLKDKGNWQQYSLTALHVDAPSGGDGINNLLNLDVKMRLGTNLVLGSVGGDLSKPSYLLEYQRPIGPFSLTLARDARPIGAKNSRGTIRGNEVNSVAFGYHSKDFLKKLEDFIVRVGFGNERSEQTINDSGDKEFADYSYNQNVNLRTIYNKYRFAFDWRRSDATNSENPTETNSTNFNLSRNFEIFKRRTRASMNYGFTSTDRINNSALSIDTRRIGLSGGLKLFHWLSYGASFRKSENTSGLKGINTSETLSHTFSTSRNFFKNKVLGGLSYSFSDSKSDSDFALFSSNTQTQAVTVNLGGHPAAHSSYQIQYQVLFQESNNAMIEDKVSSRLEMSYGISFHTLFGWKPKTVIDVISFIDLDGDGSYTPKIDRPIVYMDVLVNGKVIGQTNEEGKLENKTIKGWKRVVKLDTSQLPTGYVYSTSSFYEFSGTRKTKEVCYFGLALNTEISGFVFNDLNENGAYDGFDLPLKGVTLLLSNGRQSVTTEHGRFFFNLLPEGEYEVKIHPLTLPVGYRSVGPMRRRVTVKKGSILQENFPFKAQRSVNGWVRLAGKDKRKFEPLPGFEVRLNRESKNTDKTGKFTFRGLGVGRQIIEVIIPENMQSKIKEKSPFKVPIQLDKEPMRIKNFRIILHEAEPVNLGLNH